jgi:hypothetical protein
MAAALGQDLASGLSEKGERRSPQMRERNPD